MDTVRRGGVVLLCCLAATLSPPCDALPVRTLTSFSTPFVSEGYVGMASWYRVLASQPGLGGVCTHMGMDLFSAFTAYHPDHWFINDQAFQRVGIDITSADPSLYTQAIQKWKDESELVTRMQKTPLVASNLDTGAFFEGNKVTRQFLKKMPNGETFGYITVWGDDNFMPVVPYAKALPVLTKSLRTQGADCIIIICVNLLQYYEDPDVLSQYDVDAVLLPEDTTRTEKMFVNGTWLLPLSKSKARNTEMHVIDTERVPNGWTFTVSTVNFGTPHVNDNPVTLALDTAWFALQVKKSKENNPTVGSTTARLHMQKELCNHQECEPGNLMLDAMVYVEKGADAGFSNSGAFFYFKPDYGWDAGIVKRTNLTDLFPFRNTLCTFNTTGPGLYDILETGVSAIGTDGKLNLTDGSKGKYPQLSGIRLKYNYNLPRWSRITDVCVIDKADGVCKPLSRRRHYTVVTSSFLCQGNAGYGDALQLPGTTHISQENDLVSAMSRYLNDHSPYTPEITGRSVQDVTGTHLNFKKLFPTDCTDKEQYLDDWEDCEPCPPGTYHPTPGSHPCTAEPGASELNIGLVVGIVVGVIVLLALPVVWQMTAKQRRIRQLFNSNKIAEECASAIASMRLEELDYLHDLKNPNAIQASFMVIIRTLKEYRSFMPKSCLEEEDQSEMSTDAGSYTHTASKMSSVSTRMSVKQQVEKFSGPAHLSIGLKKAGVALACVNMRGFRAVLNGSCSEVAAQHSKYIATVLSCITGKGCAEPFCGDRIMLSWGGVHPCGDHARLACRTVLRLRESEERVIAGVICGKVLCGNIGIDGMKKFDFLGAIYNDVGKLMVLNKVYETRVLASSAIVERAGADFFFCIRDMVKDEKGNKVLQVTEVVSEQEGEVADADGEWMYQLSAKANNPYTAFNTAWEHVVRVDADDKVRELKTVEGIECIPEKAMKRLNEAAAQGKSYCGMTTIPLSYF